MLIRGVRSRRDFSCMAKSGVDMAPKAAVVEALCIYNKGPPLGKQRTEVDRGTQQMPA